MDRREAGIRLGLKRDKLKALEDRQKLTPLQRATNGRTRNLCYDAREVERLVAETLLNKRVVTRRLDLLTANATAEAEGWTRFQPVRVRGPFIGERVAVSPCVSAYSLFLSGSPALTQPRERRVILSYDSLAEAFLNAVVEECNMIVNTRGLIAVRQA